MKAQRVGEGTLSNGTSLIEVTLAIALLASAVTAFTAVLESCSLQVGRIGGCGTGTGPAALVLSDRSACLFVGGAANDSTPLPAIVSLRSTGDGGKPVRVVELAPMKGRQAVPERRRWGETPARADEGGAMRGPAAVRAEKGTARVPPIASTSARVRSNDEMAVRP